ncbi:MAG: TRAP transporter small permease subunit [Steroidobacteraceae bacterium]
MTGRGERVAARLEAVAEGTGWVVAWLTVALAFTGLAVVVLRYGFDQGFVWMQELLVWFHAAVFMLGAAYALRHDAHVRVDVFRQRMTVRQRAWVDLLGTLLLLWPTCAVIAWFSIPYVAGSWDIGERSREAGGLPALWLLKGMIPALAVLLAVQGLAMVLRATAALREKAGAS